MHHHRGRYLLWEQVPVFVVLGTIDRRTWRRGLAGDARLADVREHMADFKRYLRVDVTRAHWELSNRRLANIRLEPKRCEPHRATMLLRPC